MTSIRKQIWLLGALALVGCGGSGVSPVGSSSSQDTLPVFWNELALQVVRQTAPGPTVTSRALAIVHTAGYDAWSAFDNVAVGTQLGGSLRRPLDERTEVNKSRAISYAYYTALVDLFPTKKATFDAAMASMGYSLAAPGTAGQVGIDAANALLAVRHHDGSNQLGDLHAGAYSDTTGYVPVNTVSTVNDPNHWQPQTFVFPDGSKKTPGYLTPHWGQVQTFAIGSPAAFRPGPPAAYGTQKYLDQANAILEITANLNDRQKMIAEYWAKGSGTEFPPGQWLGFGSFVSRRDHHSLDDDVKMFFMLGNAEMDAGICCWDAKRAYDYVRPITAIRYLYAGKTVQSWGGPGKGTIAIKGENWIPYQPASFITPPFPEYVSGHSTFSAAGAQVLKMFTGSDNFGDGVTIAPGMSETEPGSAPSSTVVLYWRTFSEAADEAGISRRYGGIHFEDGDLQARALGRSVGTMVYHKAMTYINGTATPAP